MKAKLTVTAVLFFFLGSLLAQQTIERTLEHDNETRKYVVYVPAVYDGSTLVPLMLNFHGFSMTAKVQMEYADMRPIADTAGFILVYPEGTLLDGSTHWNIKGPTSKSKADDLGFTEALLDQLAKEYEIDEERVYCSGFSNGGFFSFDLACRLSDRIAAIGTVGATMLGDSYNDCEPSHPTAVITINGTDDSQVNYEGLLPYMYSLDAVNSYWVAHNKADEKPAVVKMPDSNTEDKSTVERYTFANGDECTSVEHYKIIGGGHSWPDVNGSASKQNVDISASSLIWNFVSQYDINGLINCDKTSSSKLPELKQEIQLYPNPTSDVIYVNSNGQVNYQVYSSTGQMVMQGIVSENQPVDIAHLPNNLYMIRIGGASMPILKVGN